MIEVKSKHTETIEKLGNRQVEPNYFKESITFNTKHNTVKEKVQSILRKDKYSRKNDFYLCLVYWIQNGDIQMKVDFKDFKKITKPETISRIRRELISEAKKGNKELKYLLNDEEILEERENLKTLNQAYYQEKKNSEVASYVK